MVFLPILLVAAGAVSPCPHIKGLNGVFMSQKSMASPTSGFIMCDGEDAPPAVSITIGGSICVSRLTLLIPASFRCLI